MSTDSIPLVSIVIKTLNEAANIARTIQSVRASIGEIPAEIIVADSYSADDTVKIALAEGAKVFRLKSKLDRSCGVGAQLGYQYAQGEFILLLDGDMELIPGFIEAALVMFRDQYNLAAIGGRMEEMAMDHPIFAARMRRNQNYHTTGDVGHLDGGGIYRKSALQDIGYFTNINLHSYEESELGCRLRAKGWRLMRIDVSAIRHYGHTTPRYQLLVRRFKLGYTFGPGEYLRASIGNPWFSVAIRTIKAYLVMLAAWFALTVSLLALPWSSLPLQTVLAGFLVMFLLLIVKRNNFSDGVFTFVSWSVFALSALIGFFRRQRCPTAWIDSCQIVDRVN